MNPRLFPNILVLVLLAMARTGSAQPVAGPVPDTDAAALPEALKVGLELLSPSGPGKIIVTFAPGKAPAGPWRPDWPALSGPFAPTGNPLEFSAPLDLDAKNIAEWNQAVEKAGLTWPDRFGNPVPYQIDDLILPDKIFPWSMELLVGSRIIQQPLGYPIDPFKSLLVRNPDVVNDPARTWDPAPKPNATPYGTIVHPVGTPDGVWTFHHLVSCLANEPETGVSPSALVQKWLDTWATPQQPEGPDGNVAAPRDDAGRRKLIEEWPVLGGSGGADGAPQLDTAKAPFRLLGIVNRFDLRSTSAFGSGGTLAELRFVFGAVHTTKNKSGDAQGFLVIFEFGVPLANFREVHQYAREWAALSQPGLDPAAYLAKLESLTERIVRPVAASTRPNRSNLNQVRTSELAFGHTNWEFREFHLDAQSHHLKPATIAQTPDPWVNEKTIGLRRWIQTHSQEVKDSTYVLPELMEVVDTHTGPVVARRKLRGVMAQSGAGNTNWVSLGGGTYDEMVRMAFIRNTCNGCHTSGYNGGPPFNIQAHVDHRSYANASIISPFLHNPAASGDDLRKRLDKLRSTAESHPILPFDEFFLRSILQVH